MLFSQRLKELRNRNNYSMDKLAELYNIRFGGKLNKSTISRYENNLQEPMFSVVMNLSELFNVSVDYLIGTSKNQPIVTIPFIDMYNSLNALGKEKAQEYITDLSEQPKYTSSDEEGNK